MSTYGGLTPAKNCVKYIPSSRGILCDCETLSFAKRSVSSSMLLPLSYIYYSGPPTQGQRKKFLTEQIPRLGDSGCGVWR